MEDVYIHPEDPQEKQPVIFTAKDWLCLLLVLGLAILFRNVFNLANFGQFGPPGLGVMVLGFALFAVVFFALGKKVKLNFQSVGLTLAALLLALCCFLYGNPVMAVLNCFIVLAVGAAAVFSLAGLTKKSWREFGLFPESFINSILALFTRIPAPFQALSGFFKSKKGFLGALIGILICIPVLAIVLILLTSADTVFASLLRGLTDWLAAQNFYSLLWRIIWTLALMLFLASALYFIRTEPARRGGVRPPAVSAATARALPASPFLAALILLDIVYAVFVGIQVVVLFGGANVAVLHGDYAGYARSGFFQLVVIAVINLAAVLLTAMLGIKRTPSVSTGAALTAPSEREPRETARRGRRALQVLGGILLAFTAVILVSALWRMCLYISVYGLSFLRLLTLWGMVVIAVCLVAAAVKLIKPAYKFFQAFFAFALCSWLVLNFLNVNALIIHYNTNAYRSGHVQQLDENYLAGLTYAASTSDELPWAQIRAD